MPRKFTLEAFLAEDHALIAPQGMSSGVVDVALEALGQSRRVALTVPHYLVAPAIVAQTDLIMTLPRRIADYLTRAHRLRVFRPPIRLKGFDVAMTFVVDKGQEEGRRNRLVKDPLASRRLAMSVGATHERDISFRDASWMIYRHPSRAGAD